MRKNPFYVVSLKTPKHMKMAYVARNARQKSAPASEWYITTDPAEAFAFDDLAAAVTFKDRLMAGQSQGLRNDGHMWRVTSASLA